LVLHGEIFDFNHLIITSKLDHLPDLYIRNFL
jgi:hypothetical protein